MRLGVLGHISSADPFRVGGVEAFTRRLTLACANQGHIIDYLLYGAKTSSARRLAEGVRANYFIEFRNIIEWIMIERYDVLVCLYLPFPSLFELLLLRLSRRLPTGLAYIQLGYQPMWFKRWLRYKLVALISDLVFGASPRIVSTMRDCGINAQLLLPPVPADYFISPTLKPRPDSRLQVTFAGRLDLEKGLTEFVEASLLAKRTGASIDVNIFGYHGSDEPEIRNLLNTIGNESWIQCSTNGSRDSSYKEESAIRDLLIKTDVLVLPYRTLRGTLDTPLLLLEGLATLCLIVTTPISHVTELIGSTQYVATDTNHLASMICSFTRKDIVDERHRVYSLKLTSKFATEAVMSKFLESLVR